MLLVQLFGMFDLFKSGLAQLLKGGTISLFSVRSMYNNHLYFAKSEAVVFWISNRFVAQVLRIVANALRRKKPCERVVPGYVVSRRPNARTPAHRCHPNYEQPQV